MTDVQLIFDALPPPTTSENYDALCQGIYPPNEIKVVKCSFRGLSNYGLIVIEILYLWKTLFCAVLFGTVLFVCFGW